MIPPKTNTNTPLTGGNRPVQRAYDLALIITAIALPFSNFLMSQGAFLLLFAWALDRWHNGPIFRDRSWKFWRSQPLLWAILALFAWQLLGQLWTEDLAQGWRALRIQLPLLAFPLVLITGRWDQRRGLELVQHTLAFSVAAACIGALWSGSAAAEAVEARDWSPFISHIRFSLMIAFIWSWWLLRAFATKQRKAWVTALILCVLGIAFTWKTASITGATLIPLSGLLAFLLARKGGAERRSSNVAFRRNGSIGLLAVFLALIAFAMNSLWPRYPNPEELSVKSEGGEQYQHFPDRCLRENGGHVWTHIARSELSEAWNERSTIAFEGRDDRNQALEMTLLRYLSSLGLKKDRPGVLALTPSDVQLIESGVPTVLEVKHGGLRRRWDIVQFEIWNAVDGGNPSGHSLVQRFLFLKNAFRVFQDQPALGVGTGDVPAAIAASYEQANSPLAPEFRLRPHNQYITFLISGGPLSMLLWMAILVALVAVSGNAFPTYPFQVACLAAFIIALSCMTEDTLETQAGVTLAGFLIGLIGKRTIR